MPKEEKVRIRLPRPTGKEENFRNVAINGKIWKIKKGEWVEVPKCVAEVIENSERMQEINDAF